MVKKDVVSVSDAPLTSGKPKRKNIVKTGAAGGTREIGDPLTTLNNVFPGWTGKSALNLLNEHCQKRGYEKANVQSRPSGKNFTASVLLRRRNTTDRDKFDEAYLRPPSDASSPAYIEQPTAQEARHFGAVFALFRIASSLNLSMVLAPPLKSYWKRLEEWKKASGNGIDWSDVFAQPPSRAASRANGEAARSTAPVAGPSRPVSKAWQSAPEVKMSTELRELVEATIRASVHRLMPDQSEAKLTPADLALKPELVKLGFRPGHVDATLSTLRAARQSGSGGPVFASLFELSHQEAAVAWLQLSVPGVDLPAQFQRSKPVDNIARVATNTDAAGLKRSWAIERLHEETGFAPDAIDLALRDNGDDEGSAIDALLRRLVGWESKAAGEANEQARQDEVMALESIYGDRFKRLNAQTFDLHLNSAAASLRVRLHARSAYPAPQALPTVFVHAPTLPGYLRLHLTALVIRHLRSPELIDIVSAGHGGVISELVEYLDSVYQHEVDHPPSPSSVLQHLVGQSASIDEGVSRAATPTRKAQSRFRPRPLRNDPKLNAELAASLRESQGRPAYQQILKQRQQLPAWSMRDAMIDLVSSNRVSIVSGETGSGKTTQVPAFILEHEISSGRGSICNIVVTQPRRVSAMAVAERVARERGEEVGQGLVGYAIRGERKASSQCRLLFATTGVLLRRLATGDADLQGVSHVFVDECHERSVDSDFLLLELRQLLARNRTIRIVLMSATIDEATFSTYFNNAPSRSISGRTFPVEDRFLEHILPMVPSYRPDTNRRLGKIKAEEYKAMQDAFRPDNDEEQLAALCHLARLDGIDYDLIGAVVAMIAADAQPGGVLVFVPGVAEIGRAIEAIKYSAKSVDTMPLHANLSSQEQSRVFRPPARGLRKVIVSTNVAETSITIDDIVFVVDTGRFKETTFDAELGIQRLVETWASHAAARQRAGRAGRTQPGQCFKLYSQAWTWRHRMPESTTPEMLRTPLERLILQVKSTHPAEDVGTFLSRALSPPDVKAVASAITNLTDLGALHGQRLTPLGQHLALLPVDARLGKMLVLASVFGALDPILTVVALLSAKPLVLSPPDQRDEARIARERFATANSDLLTDLNAWEQADAMRKQGKAAYRSFCEDNFISASAVRDVASLRIEYQQALASVGFDTSPASSVNSDPGLLCSIVFAGTGRVIQVRLPDQRYVAMAGGAASVDHTAREVRFFEPSSGRCFVHPVSTLFHEPKIRKPFVTTFNKQVTTKPFLRDVTELPTWAILLLGLELRADARHEGLTVDAPGVDPGWIKLKAWSRIAVLANALRQLLDDELADRIDNPSVSSSPVITAILALLARDGR